MDELLIHPRTKISVEALLKNNTHAILLVGPKNSGKSSLSNYLSSQILKIQIDNILDSPHYHLIKAENASIGIDQVRELQSYLKLRASVQKQFRVVAIYQANLMTREAQTALLKIIEEPPEGVIFVLSTLNISQLLPTLVSRTQQIDVLPISKNQALQHLKNKGLEIDAAQRTVLTAGGLAGLLLGQEALQAKELELKAAKDWLSCSVYDRLKLGREFKNENIQEFVQSLIFIYKIGLKASSENVNKNITKWHDGLRLLSDTLNDLSARPNNKHLLVRLAIEL